MDLFQLSTYLKNLKVESTKTVPSLLADSLWKKVKIDRMGGVGSLEFKQLLGAKTAKSGLEGLSEISDFFSDLSLWCLAQKDATLNPKLEVKRGVAEKLDKTIPKLTPYIGGFDDFI